ncbi:glycosyltransferase [Candidatus Fermentibacteria bacterium]|nr:glycosyltransferase [Candidatus Fermentibacteria bacterium]
MAEADQAVLGIVIPLHNSAGTIAEAVGALLPELRPGDRILAVDDRSSDGSPAVCASLGVEVAASDRPPGAAGTRNSGAARCGGGWILFVDSDAVAPPGWRAALEEGMREADAIQAVYASRAPGRSASTFYKNFYYHYTFTRRIRTRYIPGCGTFFFAVRRDLFERLGGFDERIAGATVEDADFAARLTAAGGRILLLKGLEVFHLREYDFPGLMKYDWRMIRAKTMYMARRDRGHGSLSLSMAGAAEMVSVAVGAGSVWLAVAGAALSFAHPAGPAVLAAGAAAFVMSQARFWVSSVAAGGLRGLRACFVGIPDLALVVPAAASAMAAVLAGRRY